MGCACHRPKTKTTRIPRCLLSCFVYFLFSWVFPKPKYADTHKNTRKGNYPAIHPHSAQWVEYLFCHSPHNPTNTSAHSTHTQNHSKATHGAFEESLRPVNGGQGSPHTRTHITNNDEKTQIQTLVADLPHHLYSTYQALLEWLVVNTPCLNPHSPNVVFGVFMMNDDVSTPLCLL